VHYYFCFIDAELASCASETTTNDVSTFKHYRKVEHRHGPASYALAPDKKNIYSLSDLRHVLLFFSHAEQTLLSALQRPAFNIAGFRRADLLPTRAQCSPATVSRHIFDFARENRQRPTSFTLIARKFSLRGIVFRRFCKSVERGFVKSR
jgi:hypothetical protein